MKKARFRNRVFCLGNDSYFMKERQTIPDIDKHDVAVYNKTKDSFRSLTVNNEYIHGRNNVCVKFKFIGKYAVICL